MYYFKLGSVYNHKLLEDYFCPAPQSVLSGQQRPLFNNISDIPIIYSKF